MKSAQTTIFKSNRSQAVRLPKDVALPESVKRVHIVAVGNSTLTITGTGVNVAGTLNTGSGIITGLPMGADSAARSVHIWNRSPRCYLARADIAP